MVDYIDNKERGCKTKYPHLPWTDERGLDQYDPKKIIKSYSNEALDKISRRTEASAKEKLRDFKSTSKSSFQLSKSVSAATITEKIHTSKEIRKKKEIVRQIKSLKSKMSDDIDYDPKADKDVELALKSAQKHLRGRSAKAIEAYLRSESMKNIAQGVEFDLSDIKKFQRNRVVNTHDFAGHLRVMDKRMQQQLEESFVEPLDNLSNELKGFDKRTTMYFVDKR